MPFKNIERTDKVVKTDDEWKKLLSKEQYEVLRRKGTERPCSGEFWDNHEKGTYVCAGCELALFGSGEKFESGTGWPSYFNPLGPDRIHYHRDTTHGMVRDEVVCARCDGHLGHVFNDGPPPTGLRYCINSISMKFVKAK
jgi:peptide-methionine (R)-S-oxide reductase